jgi:5-formyltetrahydrofolate cyclo-ligase
LIHSPRFDQPDAASQTKPALRAAVMVRRDALSPDGRAAASRAIAERCLIIVKPLKPGCLAAYLPIRSEVDPQPFLDLIREAGVEIALPAVANPTTMVFRRYRVGDTLIKGGLGTRAPSVSAPVVEPDVILVPVVAFDRMGTRLGHGAGYYDRALSGIHARGRRPPLVGLAFSVQEVPRIPHEPHDIRLDWIVTESETLNFTAKSA